jgi:hypothetical protein
MSTSSKDLVPCTYEAISVWIKKRAHGNHGLSRVGCGNCFSAKTHSLMESDHIGLVRVCVAEWTQREGSLYSIRAEGADLAGCPSLASEKLEY